MWAGSGAPTWWPPAPRPSDGAPRCRDRPERKAEGRPHRGRPSQECSERLNAGDDALSAKAETLDQRPVTVDVDVLEVAEQTTALTDEQEEPTTRVMVVLVLLQVLGQVLDALRQHRNLHLGGSGVTGVRRVLFDDRLLDLCIQCHR